MEGPYETVSKADEESRLICMTSQNMDREQCLLLLCIIALIIQKEETSNAAKGKQADHPAWTPRVEDTAQVQTKKESHYHADNSHYSKPINRLHALLESKTGALHIQAERQRNECKSRAGEKDPPSPAPGDVFREHSSKNRAYGSGKRRHDSGQSIVKGSIAVVRISKKKLHGQLSLSIDLRV